VTVDSGVFIGPAAVLTNDRFPRAINAEGDLAADTDWVVSEIRLGEGCSIGAGAVVVAGHDVGPYATVGAGSVVTRGVPPHGLVVGNPARLIGWVCRCGRRLVDGSGSTVQASYIGGARCPRDGSLFDIQEDGCSIRERS
jgi:hypothetical protein